MVSQSIYRSSVEFFPSVPRPARTGFAIREERAGRVLPNYALRRLGALAVVVTALVLVGIIILLAGSGGRPASAFQAEPALSSAATVHVAEAGDSLWSIAEANHGDVSIDRYVDALIDLNGGTVIAVGQAVRLP
jgi:LysM repeat protein